MLIIFSPGSVSFETLTEAFGPSSLGIIVVKDLDSEFQRLRAQVLSNASYLAALSDNELGTLHHVFSNCINHLIPYRVPR